MIWTALVAAGIALAWTGLRVANPGGHWDPRERSPEAQLWDLARDRFGFSASAIVAIRFPQDFEASLETTQDFEAWVAEQSEVDRTFGPRDVAEFARRPALRLFFGHQIRELREAVLSADARYARLHVAIHSPDGPLGLANTVNLFALVREQGPGLLPQGSTILLAGKPAADVALNELLQRDTLFAAPVAFITIAVVLAFSLGRTSLGPFCGAAAAVVIVAGFLGLIGMPVSTATSVAFPITVVVSLGYGVHMGAAVKRVGSVGHAIADISRALRWAFITTTVALLSFALSPFPALRSFAYATSLGVLTGYLAALTLVPHISGYFQTGTRHRRSHLKRIGLRLFTSSARHPRVTIGVWCIVALAGVFGLFRIQVEPNNYLGFFPNDHPTIVAHRELDEAFGGSLPMFALAWVDSGVAYENTEIRSRLRSFVRAASADYPRFGRAITPFIPPGQDRDVLERWFVGSDPRYTRAIFSVPLMQTREARALLAGLDSLAERYSDSLVTVRVTGPLSAGLPLLRSLVESQVKSLAILLAAIGVAFVLACRSFQTGVLLFLPNLLAPIGVGATMAFSGIPVDFMMVVVFSMVLGVAVDDTLQLLWAGVPSSGENTFSAVRAIRRVAFPVTLTSVASVIGFGSLALSTFPVTGRLGMMMAVGLTIAWLADLTVTPLLLANRPMKNNGPA